MDHDRQRLLAEEQPAAAGSTALPRVSSNRFQVSRTAEDGSEEFELVLPDDRKAKAVSEPLPLGPTLSNGEGSGRGTPTSAERKLSNTGRFTVSGQSTPNSRHSNGVEKSESENTSNSNGMEKCEPDSGAPTPPTPPSYHELGHDDLYADSPETLPGAAGKIVQFALIERNDENRRSGEMEGNATINSKSWRNMKTIEHPPIIDFYRQSIDQDGVMNARPSMNQLIHGQKSIPEADEMEGLQSHHELLLDGAAPEDRKSTNGGSNYHLLEGDPNQLVLEKFQAPSSGAARVKFGWIQGVFVRCILNIFGVMLYMRVSWAAGEAGIGLACCIVLLASLVTTITALSTCAICTNGDVKGGGAYFLISRSLGPEFGGSIGLIFSVANAVGAAMYIVGFAETIFDVLFAAFPDDGGSLTVLGIDKINMVRIVGLLSCVLLMAIVFVGTSFESKMQIGLLVILSASIVDYMIGSFITPSDELQRKGLTGWSSETFRSNLGPEFEGGYTFMSVFAVYFPAATGIMAGANISGDLADPQRAIPLGTLLAIAGTTVIYLATVIIYGSVAVRYADGENLPVFNDTLGVYNKPACYYNITDTENQINACMYGLIKDFQVVEKSSLWGPLITAGIIAASLSSALASLVSAPKVFQAICKDRLFPKIDWFAKGYGKNEEPRRGYALTAAICVCIIMIGELNLIAPIISNFFLASYTLINYACFDQSFADSIGFRPSFRYYNKWVSLAGALLCIIVMFIISWVTALITFLFFLLLFIYIMHRKPDVNWGSSTQAHSYKSALSSMVKLWNTEEHVKNYRPQLLVLCGNTAARPSLVEFVNNITKGTSLMMCGYVVPYAPSTSVYSVCRKLDRQLNEWLKKKKIKAFYTSVASSSLRTGTQSLLQVSGLGKLRPNIVIMGFKGNWCEGGPSEEKLREINDYFGVIQDVFENAMGVGVLRNGTIGLDFSDAMKKLDLRESARLQLPEVAKNVVVTSIAASHRLPSDPLMKDAADDEKEEAEATAKLLKEGEAISASSSLYTMTFPFEVEMSSDEEDGKREEVREEEDEEEEDVEEEDEEEDQDNEEEEPIEKHFRDDEDVEKGEPIRGSGGGGGGGGGGGMVGRLQQSVRRTQFSMRHRSTRRPTQEQKALVTSMTRFSRKIKKGVIDVWWLYDDGGLTLLIPHLLTIPKSYLEGAKLRVFTISTSTRTMEAEQRSMAALLSKFRIDFSDVFVIPDIGKKPSKRTLESFDELIAPYKCPDGEDDGSGLITDSELSAQREKTYRQLRIGELLKEHSDEADLVVVTLPVPRKGLVSSCLYLAWLDMMTRHLPPTLLIRGNQTSVLTFYS